MRALIPLRTAQRIARFVALLSILRPAAFLHAFDHFFGALTHLLKRAPLLAECLTGVALYQDLPEDKRPEARESLLDGLVRFTMGGLPALTRERQSFSDARDPDQE